MTTIEQARETLKKMSGCYRGCQRYDLGGKDLHRALAALERTLDYCAADRSPTGGNGDALADAIVADILDALK